MAQRRQRRLKVLQMWKQEASFLALSLCPLGLLRTVLAVPGLRDTWPSLLLHSPAGLWLPRTLGEGGWPTPARACGCPPWPAVASGSSATWEEASLLHWLALGGPCPRPPCLGRSSPVFWKVLPSLF